MFSSFLRKYFNGFIHSAVRKGRNEAENAKSWKKSVLLEVRCGRGESKHYFRNDKRKRWRGGDILAVLVIVPIKCFEKGRDSVLFQEIPINRRKKHKISMSSCRNTKIPLYLYTIIPLYLHLICVESREYHNLAVRFACVQSFVFI